MKTIVANQLHLLPVVLSMWVASLWYISEQPSVPLSHFKFWPDLDFVWTFEYSKASFDTKADQQTELLYWTENPLATLCAAPECVCARARACTKSVFMNSKGIVFQNREQDLNP
jgi:hypothetical protein